MKLFLTLFIVIAAVASSFAQVPTETELNSAKQSSLSRPGYFYYAKPFEVTMTVNLWGEVPQQGVYVIPTNTDIIQLCLLYTSPSPRDLSTSRMPSSA